MLVIEMIEALQQFDPDQEVLCQVVGKKAGAWNMYTSITKPENCAFVVFSLSHPDLAYLPNDCSQPVQGYQCEKGHKFLALPDHPVVFGRPMCPHCAAKGGVIIS